METPCDTYDPRYIPYPFHPCGCILENNCNIYLVFILSTPYYVVQEDFYPKGPSIQFYKMFLDEEVRSQLVEYDALAIIEWDVLVASDSSFEELYRTAFAGGDVFWIKGSNVGGTNFHATAEVQEMWHVLGHINGNAIYNNKDPAFVEYIEYTRARWQYEYPYDVALWLTISDFPYSWPLWQRYSNKFVTTNLVSWSGSSPLTDGFAQSFSLDLCALRILPPIYYI